MILQVTINYNIYNPGSLPIVGTFPGLVSGSRGFPSLFLCPIQSVEVPEMELLSHYVWPAEASQCKNWCLQLAKSQRTTPSSVEMVGIEHSGLTSILWVCHTSLSENKVPPFHPLANCHVPNLKLHFWCVKSPISR